MTDNDGIEQCNAEIEELKARLYEAEETILAIREGKAGVPVGSKLEGKQEYSYRLLVESMKEGALVLTPDGTIAYSNHTFAVILSVPLEKIVNSSIFDSIANEDVDSVRKLLSQAQETSGRAEIGLKSYGMVKTVPVYLSVSKMELDGTDMLSAVVTDLTEHKNAEAELEKYRKHLEELVVERTKVLLEANESHEVTKQRLDGSNEELSVMNEELRTTTDELRQEIDYRKQTEEALQASEERLRLLVEGVKDYAIFMLDRDGTVLTWNSGAQNIKGYTAEEIIGRNFSKFYTDEAVAAGKPQRELVFAAEQGQYTEEGWRVRKDGSQFWASVNITALYEASGELRGFAKVTRDITERKQMEDALNQGQERFNTFIDTSEAIIYLKDVDGRFLIANQALADLCGLPKDDLIGKTSYDILPFESADEHTRNDHMIIRTGKAMEIEETVSTENGERAYLTQKFPLLDNQGNVVAVGGISTEITERKQAEQMIREQAALLDMASDAILVRDMEDKVAYWNKGAQEIYGWTRKEVMGRVTHDVLKTQFPKPMADIIVEVADKGRWQGELTHTTKDGRELIVASQWAAQFDESGRQIGILEINRDVTEHRQAEEEIYRSRQELKTITENLPDVVARFDREFKYIFVSPSIRQVTGTSYQELLGKTNRELEFPERLVSMWEDNLDKVFQTGEPQSIEFDYATTEGPREYMSRLVPEFDSNGKIISVLVVSRDITERKLAEEALRESESVLRAFFDSPGLLSGIIEVVDGDIRYVSVNDAVAAVHGLTPDAARGRFLSKLGTPQEIVREYVDRCEESRQTGLPVSFEVFRHLAVGDRWLLATASYLGIGPTGFPRFAYVMLDITERKQAEDALRESEERLRLLGDNIPDSAVYQYVYDLDEKPHFIYMSSGVERLNGVRVEDILRDPETLLGQILPEQRLDMVEAERASARNLSDFDIDVQMRRTDSEVRWMRLHSRPRRMPDGRVQWDGVQIDITERKQAEQALREVKERLSLALTSAQMATFDWDIVKNLRTWDENVHHLLGTSPETFSAKEEEFFQVIHPDDRNSVKAALSKAVETGTYSTEYRAVWPDGSIRHLAARGTVHHDATNRAVRMTGICWDITDRKQMEDALRESERRYSALFANKINAIAHCRVITDEQGQPVDYTILQVNEAYEQIIGIKKADIEGRTVTEVFPGVENFATDYIGILGKIGLEGGEILFEAFLEPTQQYLSIYAYSPLPGEFTAMLTDITEQKRAEHALRESEERFRTLFSSMSEGFALCEIICDDEGKPLDWRYLEMNPAFERNTGMHADEVVGKTVREVLPNIEPFWIETYGKVALTGESAKFENYVQDLNKYFEVLAFSPAAGRFAAVFLDVTDRKRAEFALRDIQQSTAESLALLDTIQAYAPVGIAFADREFHYVRINEELAIMNGFSVEDHLGHTIAEMVPELWPQLEPIYRKVLAGESLLELEISGETSAHPREQRNWLASYYPVRVHDSEISGIGMIVLDVTDRKRAENALRESEEKYRNMFDTLMEGFCVIEVVFDANSRPIDYRFLEINPAFEEQTGLRDAQGKLMRDLAPDHEAHWFEIYGKIALTGEPAHFVNEAKALNRWYNVSAYRVGGQESRKVAILFSDITEQKRAESAIREVLEREHRIADTLQKALIPSESYQVTCCDVAVKYEPASKEAEVGGDFFDVFEIGSGKVGVLIGDVSGKGLQAAIRVAAARHAVRSYAYIDPRPGKVISLANNALCKDPVEGIAMITAFFAVIDTESGMLSCANGGHETPILCSADGTGTELTISGIALGVMEGYEYPEQSISLKPGDTLVLVTDGITEARPDSQHLFGSEGIKRSVSENCGKSLDAVTAGLIEAAKKHAGGFLRDDAAIVALRLKPRAKGGGRDVESTR